MCSYDKQARQEANLLGKQYEQVARDILSSIGHTVELMADNHPYDLLVGSVVKIDVKVARLRKIGRCKAYNFHLGKKQASCDAYILFALDGYNTKAYYVPAHVLNGTVDITIGQHTSKLDPYLGDINLVDRIYYGYACAALGVHMAIA